MLTVLVKLAWRETKSAWTRFLFLFLCIALGVGAIVAVDLFATTVEHTILGDARALLGGDLEISSRRSFSDQAKRVIDSLSNRGVRTSYVTELAGMAAVERPETVSGERSKATATSQLVEIKAVDEAYPLYGEVSVNAHREWQSLLTARTQDCPSQPCFGTLVQEALLFRLHLEVGDVIRIGKAYFIIMDLLKKEPDQVANAFSLGPRVLLSREALAASELVKPGSRLHERIRLKVPETFPLTALSGELRGRLAKEGVQVSSFQEAQPRLRRFLEQLSLYLGLLGVTILLVGGLGVACTIEGFVGQKIPHIATLKTLGADSTQIIGMYVIQSLFLGGIGSSLGIVVGLGLFHSIPLLFPHILPPHFSSIPPWLSIVKGIGVGTGATLIFSVWPLLSIRKVSPALIFRQEVDRASFVSQGPSWRQSIRLKARSLWQDPPRVIIACLVAMAMIFLAVQQTRSVSLGLFFMGGFWAAILLLTICTSLLHRMWREVPLPQSFLLRHATHNLHRPGNFTRTMTLAVGLGVMLMTGLLCIQQALLDFLGSQIPDKAPTFFFIDIQPDQEATFESILATQVPDAPYRLVPVVRSRLLNLEGRPINLAEHKNRRNGWYFTREYVLTSLATLPSDNVISQGSWWETESSRPIRDGKESGHSYPLVSIEEEAAKNLGLSVGSTLTLDIQGVPLTAEVASVRRVDWSSFSMNFFMIFEPSGLDGAPFTYIATTRIPKTREPILQQSIVDSLPNVTAIHVGDVLNNIIRIFEQLARGIKSLALLCLVTGGIVMIAAISINRYRRIKELAILKALGGTQTHLISSLGIEFGLIGGFAGLAGLGLGTVLAWALLHFFFDLPLAVQPSFLVVGWCLTILGTTLTGLIATYRLLQFPPLRILRQD